MPASLGDVLVLQLRGAGFFDESVLAGWQRGLVEGLAGAPPTELVLAGEPGLAAAGEAGSVAAFRDGDVFVVTTASTPQDAALVAGRMREARRRGDAPPTRSGHADAPARAQLVVRRGPRSVVRTLPAARGGASAC